MLVVVGSLASVSAARAQAPSPSPTPSSSPPPAVSATSPIRLAASVTIRQDFTRTEDQPDLLLGENGINGLRARIRLGVEYRDPKSVVNGGLRVSTGENPNPTSPFIRLGDSFRSQSFGIDQFSLSVRPFRNRDVMAFTAGKMPLPFWRGDQGTLRSEMVWDDDVNPVGLVLQDTFHKGGDEAHPVRVDNTLGYFVMEEPTDLRFAGITGKAYLVADQFHVQTRHVSASVAYYAYRNLNAGLRSASFVPGQGAFLLPGTAPFLLRPGLQLTNQQVNFGGPGADGFVRDEFDVVDLLGQVHVPVGFETWGAPQAWALGEYAHNFRADRHGNGWGVSLGLRGGAWRGSGPHPYNLWVTYRDADADAVLATFADSDLGAGTAFKGLEAGANYRFERNLMLAVSYFDFEGFPQKDNSVRRWFVDLTWDF
jgi:hypothetical protein